MKLYDDLVWRGLIKDFSSPDLIDKLNNEKLTFYIGTDPTADSLHLGHLSSFLISKRLKDYGHNPILLVGGGTGLIGDPRPTAERDTIVKEELFRNTECLKNQVQRLFGFDVVNNYDERQLADIIYRYGEEKFSRRIAANIVKARAKKPIETTFELVDIIKSSMPQKAMRDAHPARRTFQAIRIEVNAELDVLKSTLEDAFDILAPGGRIAIISFHSLEDRIVKEQFAKWCQGCTCPKEFPVCVCGKKPKGKTFKSISPSKEELEENPRARSSRLRIFEKF